MDVGKSFSYQFEDNNWITKLLIGALVSAVPILNFAWLGYMVDLLRNVMDGVSLPLPEWSDFGEKFMKGLIVWLAGIVYSLPAIIIGCIPFSILAFSGGMESGDLQDTLLAAFTGLGLLFGCLIFIYFLALSFFFPAVYINFARKGTFKSCFEFSEIIRTVTSNVNKYLTAWLVSIVAGIVVSFILGIVSAVLGFIPCLGWIIAWLIGAVGAVYGLTIYAHLFGQAASTPSMAASTTM